MAIALSCWNHRRVALIPRLSVLTNSPMSTLTSGERHVQRVFDYEHRRARERLQYPARPCHSALTTCNCHGFLARIP